MNHSGSLGRVYLLVGRRALSTAEEIVEGVQEASSLGMSFHQVRLVSDLRNLGVFWEDRGERWWLWVEVDKERKRD